MTFRDADSQITGDPVCEAGSKDGEEGGVATLCLLCGCFPGWAL